MHLVSHVRSTIKILGESIRRIFRCSMRIFASISCRQLRRCDGSIDIGCLRHENGWVWVGGRRCLATPDDVIARFVSIGLNDCPRPVLTMISQLNRNHGIFDRVAVDGRWGLRRRRTREHQKRYRKNTHGLSSIPSRDQDWARFLGQYAVGHPNPLLSVIVCRSSQLESSIAALAPRALIRLDRKLAAKARATIKLSPG
jgi:hypothetical protein